MQVFIIDKLKDKKLKSTRELQQQKKYLLAATLTKVIHWKPLKHTGSVANKVRALVVSDGGDQRTAQADHEISHGQAEDKNVHRLEERRIPQHHHYDETVVKNWQHRVDEHEES